MKLRMPAFVTGRRLRIGAILATGIAAFWIYNAVGCKTVDPLLLDDVSRLNQTRVAEVVRPSTEEDIKRAVRRARETGAAVSISGAKHSQGGHAFHRGAIHLDMTEFNQILAVDEVGKTIRVQSGATWRDIQDRVNGIGLSVQVMQSSNIFTVGGTLSANAHGRDPRFGPVIETVRSFRLLTANGEVLDVNRAENQELFGLVIGGFGLFGVILDVELDLTENTVLEKRTVELDYAEYVDYFENNVRGKPNVGLHFGRLSIDPDTLLRDGYAVTYFETAEEPEDVFELARERNVRRDRFVFGMSRNWDWAKRFRWASQKSVVDDPSKTPIVSRNNAMRPPITFLEYTSDDDTDILQEYFIAADRLVEFIDELRAIVIDEHINLLSITLRYVPENDEAHLSYAKNDSFAVVLYINQKLSAEGRVQAENWTRRLVNAAQECGGTYYLVYQRYPKLDQLKAHYPNFDAFVEHKRRYDPNGLFMNGFFEHYASER